MQKRSIVLVLMAVMAGMNGCAAYFDSPAGASLKLARESLGSGNEHLARQYLEEAAVAPPVIGITDEALFRLALLRLGDNGVPGNSSEALLLLQRLSAEFPDSIWNKQAAQLRNLLVVMRIKREQQSEVKALRERNNTLIREKRELRETIERLKKLDLDLERKKR